MLSFNFQPQLLPGLRGPDNMVVMVMMAKMVMMIMVMVMMVPVVCQNDNNVISQRLIKISLLIIFILCPLFVCGLGNNVISQGVWQGVGTLREGKDHFTPLFRALSGMGFEIAGGKVSLLSTVGRCVI